MDLSEREWFQLQLARAAMGAATEKIATRGATKAVGYREVQREFQRLMAQPAYRAPLSASPAASAPPRRRGPADFGPRQVWDYDQRCHVTLERRDGRLYVNGIAGKATEWWPFAVGQTIMGPQLAVKVATSWGEYLLAQEEIA